MFLLVNLINNECFSKVVPSASDMNSVYWDESLAWTALKWAENQSVSLNLKHDCDKCRVQLNDKTTQFGQNIYMTLGFQSDENMWLRAVKLWYKEISNFNYGGENESKYLI